jgi:radical SAM superfamily enzyme
VGLETGHNPLLKLMKKGVTASQHVDAGQKVIQAGMELSEYVMPGLGGQAMWREHAIDTAKVLNAINPHFIRLRSLRIPERVPLHQMLAEGEFTMQTDDLVAQEIRLFIETLEGITSVITSDHSMNLLEEVTGKLPEDKEKMLAVIRKYENLPDSERLIFRVGRRGGAYRSTDDLQKDSSSYDKIRRLVEELKDQGGEDGIEAFIRELADRYV